MMYYLYDNLYLIVIFEYIIIPVIMISTLIKLDYLSAQCHGAYAYPNFIYSIYHQILNKHYKK